MRALSVMMMAAAMLAGPVQAAPAADGVKEAWVRINPAPGRPAAGYFTFRNGPKADALVAAEAPGARVEIHTMLMEGGVMRMQKLDRLDVKAGETVTFKSGGHHLMLFGLERPGATLPLTLVFESGARVQALAEVRQAGAAAQPANPHAGH